jgi:hypothetical protein
MRFRLMYALLGAFAACVLAGPSAHAFTIENKDEAGQYGVPKFDLEEQAKNFRKSGDATTPGQTDFSTPLGNGSVSFGVTQGPAFGSGFGMGALGPSTRNSRQEFDRMVAPPTSLQYDSGH